jgi:perosamine synthetase
MIPIYEPYRLDLAQPYVDDCIKSGWVSSRGEYVEAFEEKCADILNIDHAISVSNGTVALMLVLAAMLERGDEVLVPSLTYAATVSQLIWLGLKPILFDSTEDYQASIRSMHSAYHPGVKAILLPELYGSAPVKVAQWYWVAKDLGMDLIEDAAEVFGSTVAVGANTLHLGTLSKAGTFSFFGNKTFTTGEGGLVVTRDDELAAKLRLLRNQAHVGNFVHDGPGFNFRMTNIQAAIGLSQLEQYDLIVGRKKFIAAYYRDMMPEPFSCVETSPEVDSTEWMPLFMLPEGVSYADFRYKMLALGIDTRPCFTPVHLMPGWDGCSIPVSLDVSESIYRRGFNLPCYPGMDYGQLDDVVSALRKVKDEI